MVEEALETENRDPPGQDGQKHGAESGAPSPASRASRCPAAWGFNATGA